MGKPRHRIEAALASLAHVSIAAPSPGRGNTAATPWEAEYQAFAKADLPHREGIMAEAKAAMARWFTAGVVYGSDDLDVLPFGIKPYANAPQNLRPLLEVASGKILASILAREVPEHLIPEVLMVSPALSRDHVAPFGLSHELEANFGLRTIAPAFGIVFQTEDMQPEQRAEAVSANWYDLEARRLYAFVKGRHAKIETEGRRRATWQIDSLFDLQRTLVALNYDLADRAQYYACKLRDFRFTEVSSMLAALGVTRRPGAIRKSYWRQKQMVQERQKIGENPEIVSHVKRAR